MLLDHLAPGGCVGEAVFEAELGLQEFVDAADDVGDDRLRGVEDAALDLLLLVVGLEEVLVEVNDRVFFGVAVAEIAEHRLHVGLAESLHHFVDAELIEIDLALSAADGEESTHEIPQKGIGHRHHVGYVFDDKTGWAGNPGSQQSVGDGLGIHVGEVVVGQVVNQGGFEVGLQLADGAFIGLQPEDRIDPLANIGGQLGQSLGQGLGGGNDLPMAQGEQRRPPRSPVADLFIIFAPTEFFLQLLVGMINMQSRIGIIPA